MPYSTNTYDESMQLSEEVAQRQAEIIECLLTLKDDHHTDDQAWFLKMMHNCHQKIETEEIDLGISFNITMLDTITAKIMNIDPRQIVKADIIRKYTKELWIKNEMCMDALDEHIVKNPLDRFTISTMLRPSDHSLQNDPTVTEMPLHPIEMEISSSMHEESIIQEIVMIDTEETQEEVTTDTSDAQEDEMTIDIHDDIRDITNYQTRNRTTQPTNPFFITEKGAYIAGILMANTPGENKEEQINYLTHTFKLAKTESDLIKTKFINGNYWYTIHFKLQLDLIGCVEKINSKRNGDFKILYIKGGPEEEKKKEKTQEGKTTQQHEGKLTQHIFPSPIAQKKQKAAVADPIELTNIYNLSNTTSPYGIGMLIGTFPGSNRKEQLDIITKTFMIPIESTYINIEHINGNGWFTGYFGKEKDRELCINELNKNNNNNNKSSMGDLKIIRLEELTPSKKHIKTAQQTSSNSTGDKSRFKHKGKGKETITDESITYSFGSHNSETTVKILDIPCDFTTHRIKGAIKGYGTITQFDIHTEERGRYKTATVTLRNIKIDLREIWAIPMGEIMARIVPYQGLEETLTQRNKFTARLYGIKENTSATRIMSAVKHTEAKTVHIPLNSKSGKRRRFAIIGFKDNQSLNRAITSHIYLFGSQTWWSTKDNSKTLGEKASKVQNLHKVHYKNPNETTIQSPLQQANEVRHLNHNMKKDSKKKIGGKSYTSATTAKDSTDTLAQLVEQLSYFNTRLANLEKTYSTGKVRRNPNLS